MTIGAMFNPYPGLDERIAADRERLRQENMGRVIVFTYKVQGTDRFAVYLVDADGKLQSWKQVSLARPSKLEEDKPAPDPLRDLVVGRDSILKFAVEKGWVPSVEQILQIETSVSIHESEPAASN